MTRNDLDIIEKFVSDLHKELKFQINVLEKHFRNTREYITMCEEEIRSLHKQLSSREGIIIQLEEKVKRLNED